MAPMNPLAWVKDWYFLRRLGSCFEKLKREQHRVAEFPRFYHVLKCEELEAFNPDWKQIVLLFLLNHTYIDPDNHYVIHYLRWLRD